MPEKNQTGSERNRDVARRPERGLARREPSWGLSRWESPFEAMRRLSDEMDRLFGDFGFGRGFSRPSFGRELERLGGWTPDIEVFQRGNELVVRADLPGLTKDDVHVDITEDALTISGERKQEHEEEREGVYRAERSYGSFQRVVPLPEGTIPDSAKALFKNGVLEITMQAPSREVSRGRRLEIGEGSEASQRREGEQQKQKS